MPDLPAPPPLETREEIFRRKHIATFPKDVVEKYLRLLAEGIPHDLEVAGITKSQREYIIAEWYDSNGQRRDATHQKGGD